MTFVYWYFKIFFISTLNFGHSRALLCHGSHSTIAPARTVTNPSANQARDCLTSVINHEMLAPS